MSFSHRWRDFGLMWAYVLFNIAFCFVAFFLFTIFDWSRCVNFFVFLLFRDPPS
jgi:ABC-type multidrug transport system permease subunit